MTTSPRARLLARAAAVNALRAACTLATLGALLATGCAVGPSYHRPSLPDAQGYAPVPPPSSTASVAAPGGEAQRFDTARDISAQWWTLFQSPALNALIERAFKGNPSIDAARAVLKQAQENAAAQRGFFFPTVQAGYDVERQRLSGNTATSAAPGPQGNGEVIAPPGPAQPVTYTFHTADVTVGYTLDVFGGNRRQLESLQAQAQQERYELEAAYVTLASTVVAAAVQEASLRAQINATRSIIGSAAGSLAILRQQLHLGYVTRLDVAAQETALAQAQQLLPPLQRQLEQTRDLLRALVGTTPDEQLTQRFELASLHLPESLPLSLPSKLIEQRPDVLAAEAQVHSASAQVGVALANRLPQFSISGALGGQATQFSQMFQSPGIFWSLIGDVSAPIFEGGTLRHRQNAAQQGLLQAAAQYRSTVLTAFQNVADTLHALYSDADTLHAAVVAEQVARASLELTLRQLQAGYIGALPLLTAQQTYQQAVLTRVQAQAQRLGDTAALFQALGGGWWNRVPPGTAP